MADNEENFDEELQPKSKKGLVIAIIAVINVAIIGVVLFVVMGSGGKGGDSGGGGEARQARSQRGGAADGPIVELDGFVVNLTNSRSHQYLKTKLSVQLFAEEDTPEFEKQKSVVRNEILLQLSAIETDDVKSIEGKRALEKLLAERTNERLDMDRIASIYFTEFVTQ